MLFCRGCALQSCDVIRLWMQLDAVLAHCEHAHIRRKLAVIGLSMMKVSPFHLYEISEIKNWPQFMVISDEPPALGPEQSGLKDANRAATLGWE